jgi:hypothetical protein
MLAGWVGAGWYGLWSRAGYGRGVEVKRFRCRRNRRRLLRYGFELGLQFGFFALS